MSLRRINTPQVRKAYRQTGLKFVSSKWGDGIECACPITALYIAAGQKQYESQIQFEINVSHWAKSEFGNNYLNGFISGIDGDMCSCDFEDEAQGFKDGQRIRERLREHPIL